MAANLFRPIPLKKGKYFLSVILTLLITIGVVIYIFSREDGSNSDASSDGQAESQGFLLIGVNDCGPVALDNACKIYGVPSTPAELATLARTNARGTTMQGLYDAAIKKGLTVKRHNGIDISHLKQIKMPAIAYVNRNHFFLISQFVDDRLRILDTRKAPYWLSVNEFSKIWHGGHLLSLESAGISEAEANEPRIQFAEYLYDFGESHQQTVISRDYSYQNIGNAPLVVKRVTSSCECVTSFAEAQTLMPGEKGTLKISYRPNRGGFQTQEIEVYSNDPGRPVTKLTVMGFLKAAPQAKPSRLAITNYPNHEGIIERKIMVTGSRDIEIQRIANSGRGITTQFRNPNQNTGDWHATVLVSVDPSAPRTPGKKLIIYTNDPVSPKITVPIMFRSAQPLIISPNRVLFGVLSPGEAAARKVSLIDNTGGAIQILGARPQSSMLSTELIDLKADNQYQLVVKIEADGTESTLNSSVVITTNRPDSEEISIPVFAVITKG